MSKKSQFQERLVSLFLRLNGYLQSGFIPHSEEWGNAGTDIDRIALRFPNHSQAERQIPCYSNLDIPEQTIDIIIAEVKNTSLEFNETLTKIDKRAESNWSQILNWIGLFDEEQIAHLVPKLILQANNQSLMTDGKFSGIEHKNNFGAITIRPIIFSMATSKSTMDTQKWINGDEILLYIWECLCPELRRKTCSTRYPFTLWGAEFTDIIMYLKARHDIGEQVGSLNEMYKKLIK